MRLNQLSKHFCYSDWGISKTGLLNASTASSGVEKRWPLILFFTYGNKKKSLGAKSGYTADDSSNRCFECSKMQLLEPMCESSQCRGEEWSVLGSWFSWFLERQLANKWLCTARNWLFFVVLVVRLRHVQFFRKKQTIICLEVLGEPTTSILFGSSWLMCVQYSLVDANELEIMNAFTCLK